MCTVWFELVTNGCQLMSGDVANYTATASGNGLNMITAMQKSHQLYASKAFSIRMHTDGHLI